MTRIFTNEFSDTQNVEDFRLRIFRTNEVNRIRLIEESKKLTKSITARLSKNIDCKEIFNTKMFNAKQINNVANLQFICKLC